MLNGIGCGLITTTTAATTTTTTSRSSRRSRRRRSSGTFSAVVGCHGKRSAVCVCVLRRR
jgi:hypothetical protein